MKDKTVAIINADELLEWLKHREKEDRDIFDCNQDEYTKAVYRGAVSAFQEVISHVDFKKYLVEKPADTEEE